MAAEVNRTGNVYVNPVSRERAAVLESAAETGGERVRAELWAPPGAAVAFPHIHPRQSERFEVLEGRLGVRHGSRLSTALPGDRVTIPAGDVHAWWTEGDEPARVLVEVRPAGRFEEAIVTSWGLAATGHTTPSGRPGLLQLALLAEEWADTMRPASPPAWAQRLLSRTLGPLARARGLRGIHPELEERILIGRLGERLTVAGSSPMAPHESRVTSSGTTARTDPWSGDPRRGSVAAWTSAPSVGASPQSRSAHPCPARTPPSGSPS